MTLDPAIGWTLRIALSLLIAQAAIHKLRDRAGFEAALDAYRLLPAAVVGAAASALIGVELVVAVALLSIAGAAIGAAALLLLYTMAIVINLSRGRNEIGCGCGGPGGQRRLSGSLVARNLAVLTLAVVASLPLGERGLVWLDGITITCGVLVLAVLYAAEETAAVNEAYGEALR